MMLDKKQIQVIFLFELKMGPKAVETTCNINKVFGPGTANEHKVQWQFRKSCIGEESLEDEECSGRPSEVKSDQLRASLKLILLQLHEKLPKNSVLTMLPSSGIWSKLEKWKGSMGGCLMSWSKIKIFCFQVSSSLILCDNKEPFLNQILMCNDKRILYDNWQWPAQWLDWE